MKTAHIELESRFVLRWLWATSLGWLLGFVVLVALAFAWSPFGDEAQFMVGIGMGFGVGFVQSRVLKKHISSPWGWCIASTVGMGSLFVLYDLLSLVGVESPFPMPLYLITGALLTGLLQMRLLRPFSTRVALWVPACIVGWLIPAGLIVLGDIKSLGGWGVAASLTGIFLGGIPLGAVTGAALVRILSRSAAQSHLETMNDQPAET